MTPKSSWSSSAFKCPRTSEGHRWRETYQISLVKAFSVWICPLVAQGHKPPCKSLRTLLPGYFCVLWTKENKKRSLENFVFPFDPQIVKWPNDEIPRICFNCACIKKFPVHQSCMCPVPLECLADDSVHRQLLEMNHGAGLLKNALALYHTGRSQPAVTWMWYEWEIKTLTSAKMK